jgi:hypothetical protein
VNVGEEGAWGAFWRGDIWASSFEVLVRIYGDFSTWPSPSASAMTADDRPPDPRPTRANKALQPQSYLECNAF